MPYPFPSFGTFLFRSHDGEVPLEGSDSGWNLNLSVQSQRALGAVANTISVMAVGSQERQFDIMMTDARFQSLRAFVGTTAVFTGWALHKSTPDTFQAFLAAVRAEGSLVRMLCADGGEQFRRRVHIELVSQ